MQNREIFISRGAVAHFEHNTFYFLRGAVPWTYGAQCDFTLWPPQLKHAIKGNPDMS